MYFVTVSYKNIKAQTNPCPISKDSSIFAVKQCILCEEAAQAHDKSAFCLTNVNHWIKTVNKIEKKKEKNI